MRKPLPILAGLVLAGLVAALSMAACIAPLYVLVLFISDRFPTLVLVNHTDQPVWVTSEGTRSYVPAGAAAEFKYPGMTQVFDLAIGGQGAVWHYRWAPVKDRGYVIRGRIYMQAEQDGAIYLLPQEAREPLGNLPPQPDGYPLKPR